MKHPSTLRILTPVFFALALVACDSSGSEPASAETDGGELASVDTPARARDSAEREAHRDHHRKGKGHHAGKRVERLCEVVNCEAEQRDALLALAKHEPRDEDAATGRHTKIKEARMKLAAAFRGEGFSGSDVEAFFAVVEGSRPHPQGEMAARAAEAHAILTPEQRELLAQRVESGEFGPGAHRRGRKSDAGEKQGRRGGHEGKGPRAERMVERACEKLECTSEQREAITELATRHHEARKAHRESRDPAQREQLQEQLAAMIRADSLDAATIQAHMDRMHAKHDDQREAGKGQMSELAVDLHGILTPVQRVKAAEQIESGHMPGMFGGGKRRGRHGGRHH